MAANTILTVLSAIPWGQVVDNAPKVFESASKLWDSVTGHNDKVADQKKLARQPAMSEAELLKAEVSALAASVKTLETQMQASSQLIKDLAAQNTLLVQRVELSRVKHLRLVLAMGVAIAAMIVLFVYHVALH
jgi:hypothetical protein